MVLGKAGAAIVIEEKDLSGKVLIDNVNRLYSDKEQLNTFAKRAAALHVSDTADRVFSVIEKLLEDKKE